MLLLGAVWACGRASWCTVVLIPKSCAIVQSLSLPSAASASQPCLPWETACVWKWLQQTEDKVVDSSYKWNSLAVALKSRSLYLKGNSSLMFFHSQDSQNSLCLPGSLWMEWEGQKLLETKTLMAPKSAWSDSAWILFWSPSDLSSVWLCHLQSALAASTVPQVLCAI